MKKTLKSTFYPTDGSQPIVLQTYAAGIPKPKKINEKDKEAYKAWMNETIKNASESLKAFID